MAWLRMVGGAAALVAGLLLLRTALARIGRPGSAIPRRAPVGLCALIGAMGAAVLQSSSITAVATLVAADAGQISLAQAAAAIAGENVGTTLLPQLLAWHLPPSGLAVLAVLSLLACLDRRLRRAGLTALAIALLLAGFALLAAMGDMGELPVAAVLARAATGPALLAFSAGVVATALLQSSGLTIALAQGLAAGGVAPLAAGMAFVAGANVGTTSDVLLLGLTTGRRGRSVALFHLAFNALVAAATLATLGPLAMAASALHLGPARALAHLHSASNLVVALALLPLLGPLGVWAERYLARRA